ncbi:MAG: hypothetical protein V4634_00935 [Pseudomonadota bacterium]
MSSKENHHSDEAEFEEFLQGRGELARHLQALPQDTPSPALDAAIFAKVEAALKSGAPAPVLAANDADIPEAAGKPAAALVSGNPSFRQRWWRGAPFATAASVAIVGFLGLQWRHQLELDSPAPVYTPAPAVQAPPVSAAPQNEPQAVPPAQAPAESSARPPVAMSPPPAPMAEKSRAKAVSRPAPAQDTVSAPATPSPVFAGKLAEKDIAAAKLEQAASGYAPAEVWQGKKMEIKEGRVAQVPSGTASLAAPAPLPALRSAPIDAAPTATEAASGYARQAGAADARLVAPYASNQPSAPSVLSEKQAAEAKERLDLIEELLKAGLRRDALAEWDKFRKAYPAYPVPDSVTEKIRGLQK